MIEIKDYKNIRQQLTSEDFDAAIIQIRNKIEECVEKKGSVVFASNHEIYGRILQELHEYEEAIHLKFSDEEKVAELIDVATAAIWGICSIMTNGVDW